MGRVVMMKEFPADLHHRAKVQAAKEAITMKELFIKAVEEYLKKVRG